MPRPLETGKVPPPHVPPPPGGTDVATAFRPTVVSHTTVGVKVVGGLEEPAPRPPVTGVREPRPIGPDDTATGLPPGTPVVVPGVAPGRAAMPAPETRVGRRPVARLGTLVVASVGLGVRPEGVAVAPGLPLADASASPVRPFYGRRPATSYSGDNGDSGLLVGRLRPFTPDHVRPGAPHDIIDIVPPSGLVGKPASSAVVVRPPAAAGCLRRVEVKVHRLSHIGRETPP